MRSALCTIRRLLSRRAPWSLLWQSLTWQGALIAVNFFLAFRGVQIWQLIQKVKVVQILHRVGWVAPLTHTKSVSKVSFQWHTEGHDQWRPGAGPKFNTDHTYFTVYSQPDMFDCTLSQYTDKDKPRVLPVYTLHTPHAGARKTR